jgi:hypothetical protein
LSRRHRACAYLGRRSGGYGGARLTGSGPWRWGRACAGRRGVVAARVSTAAALAIVLVTGTAALAGCAPIRPTRWKGLGTVAARPAAAARVVAATDVIVATAVVPPVVALVPFLPLVSLVTALVPFLPLVLALVTAGLGQVRRHRGRRYGNPRGWPRGWLWINGRWAVGRAAAGRTAAAVASVTVVAAACRAVRWTPIIAAGVAASVAVAAPALLGGALTSLLALAPTFRSGRSTTRGARSVSALGHTRPGAAGWGRLRDLARAASALGFLVLLFPGLVRPDRPVGARWTGSIVAAAGAICTARCRLRSRQRWFGAARP